MHKLGPLFTLILIALSLWLGVITFAHAQHIESSDRMVLLNAVTDIVGGQEFAVDRFNTLAFDLSIDAGTATIRVDISADADLFAANSIVCIKSDEVNRDTHLLNMTATGLYQCNLVGAKTLRIRTSACAGCNVTVIGRATTAHIKS